MISTHMPIPTCWRIVLDRLNCCLGQIGKIETKPNTIEIPDSQTVRARPILEETIDHKHKQA